MGGGSTTTETKIPAFLQRAMQENIARGRQAASIGYTPYYGPDVAAMTPMQEAAMANTNAGASAFGLAAGQGTGMPEAQTFAGGVRGYSSAPMFEAALAELKARNPAQYAALLAPFINPKTGAAPVARFAPPAPAPRPAFAPLGAGRTEAERMADMRMGGGGNFASSGIAARLPGGVNTRDPSSVINQAVARATQGSNTLGSTRPMARSTSTRDSVQESRDKAMGRSVK